MNLSPYSVLHKAYKVLPFQIVATSGSSAIAGQQVTNQGQVCVSAIFDVTEVDIVRGGVHQHGETPTTHGLPAFIWVSEIYLVYLLYQDLLWFP